MPKLRLKDRDLEALRFIGKIGFASIYNISCVFPRAKNEQYSYQNWVNRLHQYLETKLICEIDTDVSNAPKLFSLTKKGKDLLEQEDLKVHSPAKWSSSSLKHELYINHHIVYFSKLYGFDNLYFDRYGKSQTFDPVYRQQMGRRINPDLFLQIGDKARFFVEVDCRKDEKDFLAKIFEYARYQKRFWHSAYKMFCDSHGLVHSGNPPLPPVIFFVHSWTERSFIDYRNHSKVIGQKTKKQEARRLQNALRLLNERGYRDRVYLTPAHDESFRRWYKPGDLDNYTKPPKWWVTPLPKEVNRS